MQEEVHQLFTELPCEPIVWGRFGGVVRSLPVDTWTFIWLMVFLKIPIVALLLLVRWAVRAVPEPAPEESGGIGSDSRRPRHPRPTLPRLPRRDPGCGGCAPQSPPRTRTVLARARPVRH